MNINLEALLEVEENKYEIAAMMIKYAKNLAQNNDNMLEIKEHGDKKVKITVKAINDVLGKKVKLS